MRSSHKFYEDDIVIESFNISTVQLIKQSNILREQQINQRARGFYWMIVFAVTFAVTAALTKQLYIRHPELGNIEVVFLRCFVQFFFFAALIGRNAR
jgi:hypothetical protein